MSDFWGVISNSPSPLKSDIINNGRSLNIFGHIVRLNDSCHLNKKIGILDTVQKSMLIEFASQKWKFEIWYEGKFQIWFKILDTISCMYC